MNYELKEVVPGRLELPTSTLSVWRSDQLSYRTELERHCGFLPDFTVSRLRTETEAYKNGNEPDAAKNVLQNC